VHVATSYLEGHTTYTSEYQDVIEMTQSTEIHMNGSGSGSDTSELLAGAHCLRHQVNSNGIEQVFAQFSIPQLLNSAPTIPEK